jgi:hypothetical protein
MSDMTFAQKASKEVAGRSLCHLVTVLVLTLLTSLAGANDDPAQPIATLRDFAKEPISDSAPAITFWSWPQNVKQEAKTFSQSKIVEVEGKRALSLTFTDKIPWGANESYRVSHIGPDLLPPAADAIVFRCRVISGAVTFSVGGPTIYFGHSDVQTDPVKLTANDHGEWQNITISLHDRLVRNFRRAGFARQSPVIYYTRWIQEPLGLYVHKGSVGTLEIQRIDLINQGRGKAYPAIKPDDVKVIAAISDFTDADSLKQVFTATHEAADFQAPPKPTRPSWRPPMLTHLQDAQDGHQGVLNIAQLGAEEVAFTGIKVVPAPQANAIAIDMRASNPLDLKELSVDWILYAAPVDAPLDWDRLRPPESWRNDKASAFDFYLTPKAMQADSYAFYHTRRALPNGQWTQVILPLPDFACVFGSGKMAPAMANQTLPDPAQVIALGFLPSFRQHRQPTTFQIDRIQWVHIPGDASSLQSFPQIDPVKVHLIPWGPQNNANFRQMVPAH